MREGRSTLDLTLLLAQALPRISHISPAQRAETLRLPSMTDKTPEALLYSRRIDASVPLMK
jgi:hypothetical protein